MAKIDTLYDQNGQKNIPVRTAHTYIACNMEYSLPEGSLCLVHVTQPLF